VQRGFLPFIVLIIATACSSHDKTLIHNKTISDFQNNLKSEDTYDTLLKKFGSPSKDIGSGIHIYVYPLRDSTEVWIGYTDKILYARQVNKEGKILKELIQ